MFKCFVWMQLCTLCACTVCPEAEEVIRSLETGNPDGCETALWYWLSNIGPLVQQPLNCWAVSQDSDLHTSNYVICFVFDNFQKYRWYFPDALRIYVSHMYSSQTREFCFHKDIWIVIIFMFKIQCIFQPFFQL